MPKLNSRRDRDARHGEMTAAAEVIIKNEKAARDEKTEKLRRMREARDIAASTSTGGKSSKKGTTAQSIPVEKLTSQNDT